MLVIASKFCSFWDKMDRFKEALSRLNVMGSSLDAFQVAE